MNVKFSKMIGGFINFQNFTQAERLQIWRTAKDIAAKYGVAVGGIGVIIAIALIFFYLLYVVFPLFIPASIEPEADYSLNSMAQGKTVRLAMEEQNEIGVRFNDKGSAYFFSVETGRPNGEFPEFHIDLAGDETVSSFAAGDPASKVVVYGLDDGRAWVLQHDYKVTYPGDTRLITPRIVFPVGEEPLHVDPQGQALELIAAQLDEESATVAALTSDGRVVLTHLFKEESFLMEEVTWESVQAVLDPNLDSIDFILIDKQQRHLYLANNNGLLSFFDIRDKESPRLLQHLAVVERGKRLTELKFLNGDLSLLAGDSDGGISQWTAVRDAANNPVLTKIRVFDEQTAPITQIAPEQLRKGFLALDAGGTLAIYHSTAHNLLLKKKLDMSEPAALALSPRANAAIVQEKQGPVHFYFIHNEHPEVSWSSLWSKVWYESYSKPRYIWQSSSASNDFEPKFSLTPLVFGTLKAAFYAMLIAIPLAIMGAIYTAYFMAPRMRQVVKPSIEIMEALPTVILGFLAGLWLAPLLEEYLPGIFALLLVMPIGVLAFAYLWHRLPEKIRHAVPHGWDAALLIPVVLFLGWASLALSQPLEAWLFDGNMRIWMQDELGIGFDQRNSIVVGLAMGFAVIPTIFSITEDAIFSVPKHLTYGSLALGATPWQTMVRVVLLTASPGIFSAVMIGLGRAVGETMIVLMATGNTPVMDFSIFQGMRTLSANIAVEMPESEVDSTHYRVLFLAALVLFLFTFVFNTVAELVRQRLRVKYSSL
jgi:phosphate transport system permease protein